jgi:hypothetical protein
MIQRLERCPAPPSLPSPPPHPAHGQYLCNDNPCNRELKQQMQEQQEVISDLDRKNVQVYKMEGCVGMGVCVGGGDKALYIFLTSFLPIV